jgi:DNA-binding NarL/FixJ family response regulator
MIRVLVVDDHAFIREGIVAALRVAGDFDVVGSCANGEQAVVQAEKSRPDVVLMDLSMPVLDGVDATRQIMLHDPAARVVILTATANRRRLNDAKKAGAVSCLFKDAALADVISCVRSAASLPPILGGSTPL